MPDSQSTLASAPKINKQDVEQNVSWLGARLREKSTYAGLAVLLGVAGLGANAGPLANDISLIGMGIGGLLAVLMPEKGSVKALAWFILAAAALAFGQPAHAQSVPVPTRKLPIFKAPQPQLNFGSYQNGGCGLYYGLNTMGAGGAISGGPIGATQIQGDIGVTLGYGCPIGTAAGDFWFAEGNFDFANINGSQSGLAFTGPAHFEQRIGAGGPISAMLNSGLFPNLNPGNGLAVPSLPGLPAGVTAGPSYPFLFVSLHEEDVSAQFGLNSGRQWLVSPGVGIGLQSRLSNNVVAETAAQWVMRSNGLSLGPQKIGFGNGAEVSFTLKY